MVQFFIHAMASFAIIASAYAGTIVAQDIIDKRSFPASKAAPMEIPKPFHPKNLCNIEPTSRLSSKKIDNFAYECMHAKGPWFPIKSTEANYIDVVRNINNP